MRVRTCSLYTYAQIINGENLIWRFCDRLPNRQIKALAKISCYTVPTCWIFSVASPSQPLEDGHRDHPAQGYVEHLARTKDLPTCVCMDMCRKSVHVMIYIYMHVCTCIYYTEAYYCGTSLEWLVNVVDVKRLKTNRATAERYNCYRYLHIHVKSLSLPHHITIPANIPTHVCMHTHRHAQRTCANTQLTGTEVSRRCCTLLWSWGL